MSDREQILTLLVTAHTAGNTSQFTVRNFINASAFYASALGLSHATAEGNIVQEDQEDFK